MYVGLVDAEKTQVHIDIKIMYKGDVCVSIRVAFTSKGFKRIAVVEQERQVPLWKRGLQ